MADVIAKEPETALVKHCVLRWFEVADAMRRWLVLTQEGSDRLAQIGPAWPLDGGESESDYSKRFALGLIAMSKVEV